MTASNFNTALTATLVYEGGWSDHPRDPGGATMKGVTLARYRAWKRDPNITKTQLREISDADVKAIYRDGYWRTVAGDDLPSGLDLAMFDFAVNSGPARAVKTLQRIVGVPADGVMGQLTLSAVRKQFAADMIDELCNARLAFVRSLSTFDAFGKGWTRRIGMVQVKAHALARPGVFNTTSDDTATKPAPEKARASDTKATAKPGVKPAAAATAGAVATAATAAAQQLQGLSEGLEWLKWAVVGLTIVACAAGLYVALRGNPENEA
jgi:lysozyme family protein